MAQSIINVSAILGNSKVILYGDFFSKSEYLFLLEQYIREYQLINMWNKINLSKVKYRPRKIGQLYNCHKKYFLHRIKQIFSYYLI